MIPGTISRMNPYLAIAYPVSLKLGKHEDILVAVKDAGYDIGFSTSSGLGPLGPKTNPFDIQRFWVDPEQVGDDAAKPRLQEFLLHVLL